jgi:sugar phosphate isomerase/epimerase
MTLRLAVATEDFGQPLRQAIHQAAQNPVHGLRLNARTEVRPDEFSDTALRQLKLYVDEHRMRIAGVMYSSRHSLYDEQSLDQRLDGIRAAMSIVRKLGTSEVLVRVGRIPDPDAKEPEANPGRPNNDDVDSLRNPFSFAPSAPSLLNPAGPSEARRFDTLCDILNDLAAHGSHHGAVLQLQLASYDLPRVSRLLSRISGGPANLVFDPATCVMTGKSPVPLFRELYRQIGYIRARDAQKDVDGGGIETPLGDGGVDWTELMPTLVEAEFGGWVCIERTGGDQRDEDVNTAVARLRTLLPVPG